MADMRPFRNQKISVRKKKKREKTNKHTQMTKTKALNFAHWAPLSCALLVNLYYKPLNREVI